jgi:hypothetical protein
MRLAKLSDLAKVDDVVLFDDRLAGGRLRETESTLVDFDVVPVSDGGAGGALIVLSTTRGTFLYHVDSSGHRMSLPLERERE